MFDMSDLEHQNNVRARVDRLVHQHQQHSSTYVVEFGGIELLMMQEVFCPAYGDGTQMLAECLNLGEEEQVLEVGTGSGALAILCAFKAKSVVATDISPLAVQCARMNVDRHNLHLKVDVREGNLFEPLKSEEKFSLILFNPPFLSGQPKTQLETAIYDEEYRTLSRFFAGVHQYLAEEGRILISFSTVGDINLFESLVQNSGLDARSVNKKTIADLELEVYELKRSKAG